MFGGPGGSVSVSPYGDPAIPALRFGTALARHPGSRVHASSARLVEPVAVLILPPLRQTKKPPFRVAFLLVEPGGIEPPSASPPQTVLHT